MQGGTTGTPPDMVRPACPWQSFDAAWYGATYLEDPPPGEPDEPFAHYTRFGARRGLSPNRYFDEAWYRARYPEVRDAIARGAYPSGFAHYCAVGFTRHDPHWLFAEQLYRTRRGDLSDADLAAMGLVNGYQHYLLVGQNEEVSGSDFFDAAMFSGVSGITENPFTALLDAPFLGNLRLSVFFDPDWYLAMHEGVEDLISDGAYTSALHHFLTNPTPHSFSGSPDFDEAFYTATYSDVREALQSGGLRTGWQHFVQNGRFENRRPSPWFDPDFYRRHKEVERAISAEPELTAFDHYLRTGKQAGLAAVPAAYEVKASLRPGQEAAGKDIFARMAHLWAGVPRPHFARPDSPDVSVVICAFNQIDLTLQTLLFLSGSTGVSFEVILIDNASHDATRQIEAQVPGLVVIRNTLNLGFVAASNQGIAAARGRHVLLLNNDVVLPPNALALAAARLDSDPGIGVVGARVVRSHGQLQEAGCLLFQDGSALGYGRDRDPHEAEFGFLREVDFVSGLFLMTPRAVLQQLGPLDPDFAPAYYEDTDYCVRVWEAGLRVVYDPAVVVVHLEYGSSRNPDAPRALMRRNREIFVSKHREFLATRQLPHPSRALAGRSARRRTRVLVVEDVIPYRHLGSGFVRSVDIVASLMALDCDVSVLPINPAAPAADPRAGFDDRVELLADRCITDAAAFFAERAGFYDVIWICRAHNLDRLRETLGAAGWAHLAGARIVLDTEALASNRRAVQAALTGRRFDHPKALKRELRNLVLVQDVVSVNEAEARQLRAAGIARVHVLGHSLQPTPSLPEFDARRDILALGALYAEATPNVDGLRWFLAEVWPLLRKTQRNLRLHIAGFIADGFDADTLRGPGVVMHGFVEDPGQLFASARLFLAPTRFAAGIPYKVHEAAARGLPVMTTDLLAEQLGWQNGVELAAAPCTDPKAFAATLLRLYGDAEAWSRIRTAALARIGQDCDPAAFTRTVATLIGQTEPAA